MEFVMGTVIGACLIVPHNARPRSYQYAAVHHALNRFQPIDMPFDSTVAVRICQRGLDTGVVQLDVHHF